MGRLERRGDTCLSFPTKATRCASESSPRATGSDRDTRGTVAVLYLTALLTVLALIYLGYVMIRPERF